MRFLIHLRNKAFVSKGFLNTFKKHGGQFLTNHEKQLIHRSLTLPENGAGTCLGSKNRSKICISANCKLATATAQEPLTASCAGQPHLRRQPTRLGGGLGGQSPPIAALALSSCSFRSKANHRPPCLPLTHTVPRPLPPRPLTWSRFCQLQLARRTLILFPSGVCFGFRIGFRVEEWGLGFRVYSLEFWGFRLHI